MRNFIGGKKEWLNGKDETTSEIRRPKPSPWKWLCTG